MSSQGWCRQLGIVLGVSSVVIFSGNPALAQSNIVPDNTLGVGENSIVIPNLFGLPIELITGGAQREQNIFHSFTEFNIAVGRGTYFLSPDAAIQNILARVTGSNPSEILGTLGTIGGSEPNLFLINPNGIIFGEDSKLDVGGSFMATTANAIGLGDTGRFSASEPDSSNLLNINPDVLFYNRLSNRAEIVNRSTAILPVLIFSLNGLPFNTGLQVTEGKSLLLLGGDVRLDGGILRVPGGRVELGGLSEPGTVELNADGNNFSLSFPDNVARADVSLTNGAGIVGLAGDDGSIAINARTVDILESSFLLTGIGTDLGAVGSKAGDIEIKATETVTISESSFIANVILGIGDGGDIDITTGSLEVTNGAQLTASTFGEGNAGDVRINATDSVRFDRFSRASSDIASGAVGNGGDIDITTGSLEVTNGASLFARTFGEGNAGNVKIRATDRVHFDGFGTIASSGVVPGAMGNGSNLEIITSSLEVTNGAILAASNLGEGNAGSIEIFIDSLEVTNGARLLTSGEGKAGDIKITATNTVHFDGFGSDGFPSGAFTSVLPGTVGDGGDIEIITGSLEVTNGAELFARTFGEGNAGSIKISATDIVRFDGVGSNGLPSGAFTSAGTGSSRQWW